MDETRIPSGTSTPETNLADHAAVRWFVAVMDVREGLKRDGRKRPPPRTWGFYETKEEAVKRVEEDTGFYAEDGYYTHVVIEPHFPVGRGPRGRLFPRPEDVTWYRLEEIKDARPCQPCNGSGDDEGETCWRCLGSGRRSNFVPVRCEVPESKKGVVNFTLG